MSNFKIAAGVRTDCEELLRRFMRTQSVRFEEFVKIWKEMKFSLLYCGHDKQSELMWFTDECLAIAFTFCLPPHSFQWRVGGLYLLYGLYFKQPNVVKAKIRTTASHWHEIISFIKEVVEQEHHDTHFVYWKLRQDNAFHFVAHPKQLAPCYQNQNDYDGSRCFLESSALKDMVEENYFNPLEQINSRYELVKAKLFPNDSSLSVIRSDLLTVTMSQIESFEKNRLKVVDGYLNEQEEECAKKESDEEYTGEIGSRRSLLKKRIMGERARITRSRRHRKVEMDTSSPENSPKKKKKKAKTRQKKPVSSNDELVMDETEDSPQENCKASMPSFSNINVDG